MGNLRIKKTKRVILNGLVPIIDQATRLIIGLVVSKLVLEGFGSEYNGLVTSTGHILQYLCLLEAGISTTTRVELYKAFASNDTEKVSAVFSSARYYYHRVSFVYLLLVFMIGFIYPVTVKSDLNYWIIFGVVIMQGASSALSFAFNGNIGQLFVSDGKSYINNIVGIVSYVLCNVGKVVAVLVFHDIFAMLAFNFVVTILQTIVFYIIFRKDYKWLKITKGYNRSLLPDRGPYMIMQIGYLIFNATDTIVLSMFCGFKVASVYAVYMIVYSGLKQLTSALRYNFQYTIGQGYSKDRNNFQNIYDIYQNGINMVTTCLLSVSYILIIPFISIYTQNVTDIEYINKLYPIFFTLNLLMDDWCFSHYSLMNVSGKAKNVSRCYILIGIINIVVSISLVNILGLVGVLIGTSVAVFIRNIYLTYNVNKKILKISLFHDFKRNFGNICLLIVACVVTIYMDLDIENFVDFFIWGIIITPIAIVLFLIVNLSLNYNLYKPIINKIINKIKNKKKNNDKIGEVTEKDVAVLKAANNMIKDEECDDLSKLDNNNEQL